MPCPCGEILLNVADVVFREYNFTVCTLNYLKKNLTETHFQNAQRIETTRIALKLLYLQ